MQSLCTRSRCTYKYLFDKIVESNFSYFVVYSFRLEQSLSESISAVVKTGIKEIIAACSITDHQLIKQQKV